MNSSEEELIEHRLTERIEKRVRNRLIWPIVVILSVFGFFGYDVISDMRKAAIDAAEESVRPVVDRVDAVAEGAENKIQEGQVQLEISKQMLVFIEDWMSERRSKLTDLEDDLNLKSVKISRDASQMSSELSTISDKISEISVNIQTQKKAAADLYAGAGNFVDLTRQVAIISENIKLLNNRIRDLQSHVSEKQPISVDDQYNDKEIEANIGNVIRASKGLIQGEKVDGTVYIHFMNTSRSVISTLEAYLKNSGWIVPISQPVEVMPSNYQVRYYFEGDRIKAEAVAGQAQDWLVQVGDSQSVEARDLTNFQGRKPRPGVLELWLNPIVER